MTAHVQWMMRVAFVEVLVPFMTADALTFPRGDCDCNGNQLDECGECGGPGIPAGDCDCNGNQLDAAGVCGGSCTADADSDGICDDDDDCVGNGLMPSAYAMANCSADQDEDGILRRRGRLRR